MTVLGFGMLLAFVQLMYGLAAGLFGVGRADVWSLDSGQSIKAFRFALTALTNLSQLIF